MERRTYRHAVTQTEDREGKWHRYAGAWNQRTGKACRIHDDQPAERIRIYRNDPVPGTGRHTAVNWVNAGQPAGTTGQGKRLEAIRSADRRAGNTTIFSIRYISRPTAIIRDGYITEHSPERQEKQRDWKRLNSDHTKRIQ